jgi:Tfp pilus assembly protein PilV
MTIETSIALVSMLAIIAVGMLGALVIQRRRNRSRVDTARKA